MCKSSLAFQGAMTSPGQHVSKTLLHPPSEEDTGQQEVVPGVEPLFLPHGREGHGRVYSRHHP